MAPQEPIDSAPNQFAKRAAIHSPWHTLLTTAMALSRLMEGEMDRALAIVPLKARELSVLLEVCRAPFPEGVPPEARTQRELAARRGLARGTTNELVSRLEKRGLLERTTAGGASSGKRGRPEVSLALTGKGEALLVAATRIATRVYQDWARRLGREAAGTSLHWARANGLKRWLTESLAALRSG